MANIKWLNPLNGTFAVNANWAGGAAPGATDLAQLTTAGVYTVTADSNLTVQDLTMIAGVTLDVTNSSNFSATAQLVADTLAGLVDVEDGSTLSLGGTIFNSGMINLLGASANTVLQLTGIPTVLEGAGSIVLSNNINNIVTGITISSQITTLENVDNTISGAGGFGNGVMVFSNDAAGVIDANQSNALVLDTAGNVINNAGTFETTAGGFLTINSQVNNAGGTIWANSGTITLNAPVYGGLLKTTAGGVINYNVYNGTHFNGQGTHPYTITAGTNVQIANGNSDYIAGVIRNQGTITLNSTGAATRLIAESGFVTLKGHGLVQMSDNANNLIYGSNGNYTLTNIDNTISGAGQIGAGQLHFTNNWIVNANQTVPLTINTSNLVTNTSIFEATSGGNLVLAGQTVLNTGGLILAKGAGSHVDLNGSNILGGTLKSNTGGVLNANSGRLDGSVVGGGGPVTIATGSNLLISDGSYLAVNGAIVNQGVITLNQTSSSGQTRLLLDGAATTLSGGGKVVMVDNTGASGTGGSNGNNLILSNSWAAYTLENFDNTISGTGNLGGGYLTFKNDAAGVVNANQVGGLNINTSGQQLVNAGLLEATNGNVLNGGLTFSNTGIYNAGGMIAAKRQNTHVELFGSGIYGGTLATSGVVTAGNYPAERPFEKEGGVGFPDFAARDSSFGCGPSRAVAGWPRLPRGRSATPRT